MKSRFTLSIAVLIAALHTLPALPVTAAGFAKSYRAPGDLNSWGTGFSITPSGPGFLLSAVSSVPTNQVGVGIRSFVRLNQAGEIDWALALTEGVMGVSAVKAHPTQPLLFAKIDGLATEKYWTVFGVFDGRDGTPVFETGVRVIVDQSPAGYSPDPSLNVDYLSDGRCAVVMDGSGSVVRVGVIDATGQAQWQRAFAAASSSFAIAGQGHHSALIEDPGRGFWLIVAGSQKLTTQPNPPPINFAVTLNILRLSSAGDLVWAKQIGGLQLAQVIPQFAPVVIGSDGSLIISFTDLVLGGSFNPNPTDFDTYTLAVGSDGQFRWATRVKGANLAPVAGPDASAFYLSGVQFRSIAPLNDDGVILKCNSATGDAVGQVSVNLSTAEDLTVAGVSQDGVFVQAQPYFVATGPLLGAFDLNVQNVRWTHGVDPTATSVALVYNSQTGSLLFAERPGADSRVDAISLSSDLAPLVSGAPIDPASGCQFFTNTTVSLLNPNITIEKLALTTNSLSVSVYKTSLTLDPTSRIQLRSISPTSENLCPNVNPGAPQLSFRFAPGAESLTLSFASQAEWNYEILFTPALGQPFVPLATVNGDGQVIERTLQLVPGQNGFYTVRAVPR